MIQLGDQVKFPDVEGRWTVVEIGREVTVGHGRLIHFEDNRYHISRYRSEHDLAEAGVL